MELSEYQSLAKKTIQFKLGTPGRAVPPILKLASEAGSILNVYMKYLSDGLEPAAGREFLKEQLGDLLWYLAAVATAMDIELEQIAEANLRKSRDRYTSRDEPSQFAALPVLDASYPEQERFPRRLVVEFADLRLSSDQLTASLTLVSAEPNAFPNGPFTIQGKKVGFQIGARLGNEVTDNSRRVDGYRFHDAIHMGFMAVLGWSPTLRSLLRLKRKSNTTTDEVEDGARATYAEEGLAAVLARLAERRTGFRNESDIDGDTFEVVKAATVGLEAERLPGWLWRRAIIQGFKAMRELFENRGGYLIADLDKRELTYTKVLT